jgi:pSer/pThr/pTyr-binding forkhead associated (FHA) protein
MDIYLRAIGISRGIEGTVWETETLLRVGRLGGLEIVLRDNSVSLRHAEFRANDNGWCVHDCESTNGTFVNGARVSEIQLHSGDIIQFGKVAMTVLIIEPIEKSQGDPSRRTARPSWHDDACLPLPNHFGGDPRK